MAASPFVVTNTLGHPPTYNSPSFPPPSQCGTIARLNQHLLSSYARREEGKRSKRDDIRSRRRYQRGRKIGGKIQRGILALQLRGMSGNPHTDPYICLRLDPHLPTPAKPYAITHHQSHFQEPTHPLNLDFCRIGTKPPPFTVRKGGTHPGRHCGKGAETPPTVSLPLHPPG